MKQYWFGVHCESRWTAGSKATANLKSLLETGSIALHEPYPK